MTITLSVPFAAAAKQSLLRLIPYIVPVDNDQTSLYRLVLEHGDFGIHNMSITMDANGQPLVTSLYDWETGCIVPAILSDPLMAVSVDLVTDKNATPSFIRASDDATSDERAQYMIWARQYIKVRLLFNHGLSWYANKRSNCLSRHRLSLLKRLITNVRFVRERCTLPLICVARVAR